MVSLTDLLKGVDLSGLDKHRPSFGDAPPEPTEGHDGKHDPPCPYCGVGLNPEAAARLKDWFQRFKPALSELVDIMFALHPRDRLCLMEVMRVQGEPLIRRALEL